LNTVFELGPIGVVDVLGVDAAMVVHNLTTNEVKSLEVGQGRETFITDVRGKTLAHVMLYRLPCGGFRMLGPAGPSVRIAEHVDRYTIREDATAVVRDDEFLAYVFPPADAAQLLDSGVPGMTDIAFSRETSLVLSHHQGLLAGLPVEIYSLRWLGEGTLLLMIRPSDGEAIKTLLQQLGFVIDQEGAFHGCRTAVGFPWYGRDLDDTNLPQEADRDTQTISFTKGCYLGQETVARLDALGQVQKKLVRWEIEAEPGFELVRGATLQADGKTVGRLTSVEKSENGQIIAIGFARRSHFEIGSMAAGTDEETGAKFLGRVIE